MSFCRLFPAVCFHHAFYGAGSSFLSIDNRFAYANCRVFLRNERPRDELYPLGGSFACLWNNEDSRSPLVNTVPKTYSETDLLRKFIVERMGNSFPALYRNAGRFVYEIYLIVFIYNVNS